MSKGYLTIAQSSGDVDYLRMAYALGLSIKITQSTVSQFAVAVTPDTVIPEKYKKVFDHIVEIPWKDHAKEDTWKINNKWKYYYMTPFDETVILDADMIFPSDISYWWDILKKRDVWATTTVKTFRGDTITSTKYREAFVSNNLPNVYTAFFYFKKNDFSLELFKMVEYIFNHWERFYYEFLDVNKPEFLSGDVAYALAMKIMGIENECCDVLNTEFPTFVHMKSKLQNEHCRYLSNNWTDNLPTYISDLFNMKIGMFRQLVPFHYTFKNWLTDDIINKLEVQYYG